MKRMILLTVILVAIVQFCVSAQSVTITIYYGGAQAWGCCSMCGTDYMCIGSSGCGCCQPSQQTKTFIDPIPAGNYVSAATVTYFGAECTSPNVPTLLNGVYICTAINTTGTPTCACGSCNEIWCSDSFPSCGLSGYNYGGTNTLYADPPPGTEVCLHKVEITLYYSPMIPGSPPALGAITGPDSVCAGQTAVYNVLPDTMAASYTWSVPPGATIDSGQGTPSLTLTFGSIPGDVCVYASNNCGDGPDSCMTVHLIAPFANEQICVVTVDTLINRNKVIWEKSPNMNTTDFNIYKKDFTGNYSFIGTRPYDSLSVFTDWASNPEVHSDWYRLSVIDSCANESALSQFHKTILLSSAQGPQPGQHNLIWEEYQGFTFNYYRIYRGITPHNLFAIDSVLFGATQYNDTSFIFGSVFYMVQAVRPDTCAPSTFMKTGSPNTCTSESNITGSMIVGVNESDNHCNFELYPNPAFATITLESRFASGGKIECCISDLTGRLIVDFEKEVEPGSFISNIDVQHLSAGIYFISLKSGEGSTIKKFIKK